MKIIFDDFGEFNRAKECFDLGLPLMIDMNELDGVKDFNSNPLTRMLTAKATISPPRLLDNPLMPFCGLRMDCKATSLHGPSNRLGGFLREFGNSLNPFLIKARLVAKEPMHYCYDGFHKVDYEFVLLQIMDSSQEEVIGLDKDDNQPPPIGADW